MAFICTICDHWSSEGRGNICVSCLASDREKLKADLRELKMRILETVALAQTDSDDNGFITAYHFKTGAIHRLIKDAKD